MKSVGVIGGLGPETTAEFYLEVIFQCQKLNDQQRPLIVISSVPLPFAIERDLVISNRGVERYLPFIIKEARRLETSGVDFLVMPCNSLHVFINELRDAVHIPVLSIVEATVQYLKQHNFNKVGLISTSATVANNVYEDQFSNNGITYITPNDLQHAQMDKIIQRLVAGQHLNQDREVVLQIVKDLAAQQINCVALACTDLQLLLPTSDDVIIFDTMKVLAESTVKAILSQD
jgi:aspartate racemase